MKSARTQGERILALLLQGFREGRKIPLPEILALKISQFGTRIKELREMGWQIDNEQKSVNGERHSWYSLRNSFPVKVPLQPEKPTPKLELQTAGAERKDVQSATVTASFSRSLLWEQGVLK